MSQTRIFVSSTCYDLIHMRQALNQHIVALGHIPVMSEFSSFRINPQLSAVDNCKENVRNNADVFVLVIGGKRGSVVESEGKSIVNLEYEAAVRQGLDVFVFVDQAVLTLLPIWKSNRSAVLSPAVDSNEVLAFVERVRDEQRWTFPFTKEADIIEVLSRQLSGQLRELLQKRKSGHLDFLETFKNETPIAISLVQTRAPFWEHLLTAELLETRLVSSRKRFAEIKAGRALGPHQRLTGKAFFAWVGGKFDEAKCAVEKIKFVVENEMSASWGPLGISGNPTEIKAVSDEFKAALDALLDIESDVYRTHGPDPTEPVRKIMLGMTDEMFAQVENLPQRLREAIERAQNHKEKDGPLSLSIDMKFTFERGKEISAAFSRMTSNMKPEDWNSYF